MTASLDPWMSESEAMRGVLVTEDFLGNALLKEGQNRNICQHYRRDTLLCDARTLSQRVAAPLPSAAPFAPTLALSYPPLSGLVQL